MRYVEFKTAIQHHLSRNRKGATGAELREALALPYDRPSSERTHRLEDASDKELSEALEAQAQRAETGQPRATPWVYHERMHSPEGASQRVSHSRDGQ